jgi:hypothetical protein
MRDGTKCNLKGGAMRDALLRALDRRVAVRPTGRVVLPTGRIDAADIAKVLRAIDRAKVK